MIFQLLLVFNRHHNFRTGTNDLCHLSPDVVGSRIEELARFFRDELRVKVVVVCQVIDRKIPHSTAPDAAFNAKAAILQAVFVRCAENEAGIFLWEHRDFGSDVNLLSWMEYIVTHKDSIVCTEAIAGPP